MIGCYVTGILPPPTELIVATRLYVRRRIGQEELQIAFQKATLKGIDAQSSAGFNYITTGMLNWQDLLRPFTENLRGVKAGRLERWFNNNTFYRKPIILNNIERGESIVKKMLYINFLPKNLPWKVILPAPYTFVQLSENRFYKNNSEFMLTYAQILHEEIKELAQLGFKYVQLSDPALVHSSIGKSLSEDELGIVNEALRVAVKGTPIRTCLQTFFGDFSRILPAVLDFPVDDLGIDLYETKFDRLKEYTIQKGVALGVTDSRSSLIENPDELVAVTNTILTSACSKSTVFVCPNCDLAFIPWELAREKMRIVGVVAKRLREEFDG